MLHIGKLHISGGFILICAALYYFYDINILLCFLLSAALHEFGHYLVSWIAGVKIDMICLSLFGVEMRLKNERAISYRKEILIALAGPLFSFTGAILCESFAVRLDLDWLFLFAGANALLGIFNLLPAGVFDGGRAIYFFLLQHLQVKTAFIIKTALTFTVTVGLFACGVYAFILSGSNISILIISGFLAYGLVCEMIGGTCNHY